MGLFPTTKILRISLMPLVVRVVVTRVVPPLRWYTVQLCIVCKHVCGQVCRHQESHDISRNFTYHGPPFHNKDIAYMNDAASRWCCCKACRAPTSRTFSKIFAAFARIYAGKHVRTREHMTAAHSSLGVGLLPTRNILRI